MAANSSNWSCPGGGQVGWTSLLSAVALDANVTNSSSLFHSLYNSCDCTQWKADTIDVGVLHKWKYDVHFWAVRNYFVCCSLANVAGAWRISRNHNFLGHRYKTEVLSSLSNVMSSVCSNFVYSVGGARGVVWEANGVESLTETVWWEKNSIQKFSVCSQLMLKQLSTLAPPSFLIGCCKGTMPLWNCARHNSSSQIFDQNRIDCLINQRIPDLFTKHISRWLDSYYRWLCSARVCALRHKLKACLGLPNILESVTSCSKGC